MEWKELEEHFRAATKQDPCKFGDDAIEWDHSRYSRALGLVGDGSLQQRRRSGVALLASEPVAWNRAAERYGRIAKTMGWSLLRVSARPTVAVPDPVIHELGTAIAGRDGLIFLRSGRGRRPRVLPGRARPAGASLPLRPADRWLIAADRVRRRVRNEVAERGLLLFVEDAHKLTASATSVLAYLVDAHCAWQARMLARDARVYVVFVTPPEHQDSVREMLRRFSLGDGVLVARELPSRVASPRSNGLGVEEEYLHAALKAAPLALAAEDVAGIFGASALATVARLVERGAVRERREGGTKCFVPVPGVAEDVPAAPRRVLRALLDRYRERLRTGHEHLLPAMAALAFRLDEPLRALGYLGRVAPGNTATVAADLGEELDCQLRSESVGSWLRGGHLAMWACMRAHQRDYKAAQELASKVTTIDLRSPADFGRVLSQLLACGRTHTDEMLAPDFWRSLQSSGVDPSLFDAACIFAELVASGRLMDGRQIADRYAVASRALAGAPRVLRSATRARFPIRVFARSIQARYWAFLRSHEIEACSPVQHAGSIRDSIRSCHLPAYLVASIAYGFHYVSDYVDPAWAFDIARQHMCASANHVDARFCVAERGRVAALHGLRLMTRDVGDELILSLPKNASETMRFRTARALQMYGAARAWMSGLASLAVVDRHSVRQKLKDREHEIVGLAEALSNSGDYAAARMVLEYGLEGAFRYPVRLAMLIVSWARVSFETTSWRDIAVARELLAGSQGILRGGLRGFVEHFNDATEHLTRRRYDDVEESLSRALTWANKSAEARGLVAKAHQARRDTTRLQRWRRALNSSETSCEEALSLFDRLFCRQGQSGPDHEYERVQGRLGQLVLALEEWGEHPQSLTTRTTIRVALWLRGFVESALRDRGTHFAEMIAQTAPTYFVRLRESLIREVREFSATDESWRSVDLALRLASDMWSDQSEVQQAGYFGDYRTPLITRWSNRRRARQQARTWVEDASVYARSLKHAKKGEPGRIAVYGFMGTDTECMRFQVSAGPRQRLELQRSQSLTPAPSRCERSERRPRSVVSIRSRGSGPPAFVGSSTAAQEVRRLIDVAAGCEFPVLILGNTGCGKELVARSIHQASRRANKSMVVADCGTAVDTLLESEMFGHVRGAFTGATASHEGLFARADQSTVLLDEVDSMSARMQAVLLRVLETGQYRPVGADSPRKSDFRVITAALPALLEKIERGEFRQDLYYRLGVLCIRIPPLKDRGGDVIEIATAYCNHRGYRLSSRAGAEIESRQWPGNVRQLRHCLDVASLSAVDRVIGEAPIVDALHGPDTCAPVRSMATAHDAIEAAWHGACDQLTHLQRFESKDFAREVGLSRRSAQRYLAELVGRGLVLKTGAGRATVYSVAQ